MVGFSTETTTDDDSFDYDASLKPLQIDPSQFLKTAQAFTGILANQSVMGSVETVLRESYKFIRLADDLHEIKYYLNDIRLCFIALTISGYVGAILYGLVFCFSRRRNNANHRRSNGYGGGSSRHLRDEEMQMGGGGYNDSAASAFHKPHQGHNAVSSNRNMVDATGRYTSRSLNRNFQTSGTVKLEHNAMTVVDSPSKKYLLENHAPQQQQQQHLLTPYNEAPSDDASQMGASPHLNRENGGIALEA